MKILLSFDKQLLLEYDNKNKPLIFGITWKFEDVYYPSNNWIDFGVVILNWWFGCVSRLIGGSSLERLQFMDGPYSIEVIHHLENSTITLIPKDLGATWQVTTTELVEQLLQAAEETHKELYHLNIGQESQKSLLIAMQKLRSEVES